MRIKNRKENISYDNTQLFFENRAEKYNQKNPYTVTMYQDNNPELVKMRNDYEISKLLPKLELDENSKVLDLACGIGRWSDAITTPINEYCGIDFCEGLLKIAKERAVTLSNRHFYISRLENAVEILKLHSEGCFNRILFVGALMYLNDEDVEKTLKSIEKICQPNSIICIREPIGVNERLTLKENYSNELEDNYNAIYRTRSELYEIINHSLSDTCFCLTEEDFLFDESFLNNRKETSQYYFIYKRLSR